MTDQLTRTLHEEADRTSLFSPDLSGIMREGRRRVVRRRTGVAGLGAAAVLALGLGVPQLIDTGRPDGGREGQVAVTESAPSTWAQGTLIHVGGESIDVEHEIHSFVETTQGYVSTDPDGNVWSTRGGETTKVGSRTQAVGTQLVADGPRVGWVEFLDGKAPRFVFLDQSSGKTVTNSDGTEVGMANENGPEASTSIRLFALDGDTAYLRDARGLVRLDVPSGSAHVLASPADGVAIDDVEKSQILHTFTEDGEFGVTRSSRDLTGTTPTLAVDGGDLSPSARYVMSENSQRNSDDFTLVEVATGADYTPTAKSDYAFFTGYAWIDDGSYMALGMPRVNGDPRADLLRCEVANRTCVVTVPDLDLGDTQVPLGAHIGE